jgi:hypothetical protein
MKIVRIFENRNKLLAVYDSDLEIDELRKLQQRWKNVSVLRNYFIENKEYLENDFWKRKDVKKIVASTVRFSEELFRRIYEFSKDDKSADLDELFRDLWEKSYGEKSLTSTKISKSWLRIYALRISGNEYIITGGAIKLTQTMQGHPDTAEELEKLYQCRNYLVQNNYYDYNEIETLILGE